MDHIRGGRSQPHEESDEERTSEQETELANPGDDHIRGGRSQPHEESDEERTSEQETELANPGDDHIRGGRSQSHEESDEECTSEQETELANPGDDVNSAEPGTDQPANSLSSSAASPGPVPPPSVSLPTAMDRRYPSRDRQPPDRLYACIEL